MVKDKSFWPVTEIALDKEDKKCISNFVSKSRLDDLSTCLSVQAHKKEVGRCGIFDDVVNRSSSLDFVLRVVAVTRRAVHILGRFLASKMGHCKNDLEQKGRTTVGMVKVISTQFGERQFEVISSSEISDAWNILVHVSQSQNKNLIRDKKHLMLQQVEKVLSNGSTVLHIVLGSRVKIFPIGFDGRQSVPFLAPGKLAELITQKYHDRFHVDIDATVCHIRQFIFIP